LFIDLLSGRGEYEPGLRENIIGLFLVILEDVEEAAEQEEQKGIVVDSHDAII